MREPPVGDPEAPSGQELVRHIEGWARTLGFSQIGVAAVDLSSAEPGLRDWLSAGCHGGMHYMAAHGMTRARPAELRPGTLSVITVRMDYLPADDRAPPVDWRATELERLQRPGEAIVSVYARGRDYHKVLRQRLRQLAAQLAQAVGPVGHRVFTDSAPVLEVELASRSGTGWRGKHTLALARDGGSMFFLGEIFVDLALPPTPPAPGHCGQCTACLDACPTAAIVAPYRLDARRCISYLTIEHEGPIPHEFRRAIGNRIYGCDDCQLVCPWNKFAVRSPLADFEIRESWQSPTLLQLWSWTEAEFLRHTEGSAIRRIGYGRWRRNLAVALGNALAAGEPPLPIRAALAAALPGAQAMLAEHIAWALSSEGGPVALNPGAVHRSDLD